MKFFFVRTSLNRAIYSALLEEEKKNLPGCTHVHRLNFHFHFVRWFKVNPANGAAVALVTDGRRISTGGDWFRIGQPNGDDAGRYRCQATNSQGQMEVEFRLDVHGPLRARLEPQRQVS